MKFIVTLVLLAASLFAQWPVPAEVTLTDEIYWKAQPPEVRALRALPDAERQSTAYVLATRGFTIDVPIHAWGWSAPVVMWARKSAGYTWVPSGLMPPLDCGPGICLPGMQEYNPAASPAGAIPVSVNAKDYPAFDPPPPPPVIGTNKVGKKNLVWGPKGYDKGPGAVKDGKFTVEDGEIVSEVGKNFRAHFTFTLAGPNLWFEILDDAPQARFLCDPWCTGVLPAYTFTGTNAILSTETGWRLSTGDLWERF